MSVFCGCGCAVVVFAAVMVVAMLVASLLFTCAVCVWFALSVALYFCSLCGCCSVCFIFCFIFGVLSVTVLYVQRSFLYFGFYV